MNVLSGGGGGGVSCEEGAGCKEGVGGTWDGWENVLRRWWKNVLQGRGRGTHVKKR